MVNMTALYSFLIGSQNNSLSLVKKASKYKPASINDQHEETLMTALHWAGANRNVAVAKFLFEQENPKADPWIRDRWGRLAIDLALETGNQTLIDLFHRHMFPEDYAYDFDPLDPPEGVTPIITPKPGL